MADTVNVKFIHDWKAFRAGVHDHVGMGRELAELLEESGVVIIKKKEQTTIVTDVPDEEE